MTGLFSDNLPQTVPNTDMFQNAPPPQMPQNVLPQNPLPITDAQRIPLLQDIILAKRDYETVNKGLLELNQKLSNPDLSDEDKQKIQNDIALGNRALEGLSSYANGVRNTANAIGLDISDYGSDKTLAESTQALNNYAATAVRDLFAMPSVAEQEDARMRELWARGRSPAMARRIVNLNHPKVQGEYERRLRDGIMTYGKNPDGSLNDVGVSLIHSALSSSPQTATLFGTAFALPKNVFTENRADNRTLLTNEGAMQRVLKQIEANMQNAEADRKNKQEIADKTFQQQREITQFREDRADARENARLTVELEKLDRGSHAYKFTEAYNLGLKIHGGDEKKALDYALDVTSGYKRDKKGSAAQGVFKLYDTMYSFIEQDNEDAAGKLLERITEKEETKLDEFSAEFSPEENRIINDLRGAFAKYLDFGKNPNDPKDAKSRAEARDVLTAHYWAFKRGTTPEEELAAIKNSRATARHNGTENPANGTSSANTNVRKLLDGDGNSIHNPRLSAVGNWTGHYGGY